MLGLVVLAGVQALAGAVHLARWGVELGSASRHVARAATPAARAEGTGWVTLAGTEGQLNELLNRVKDVPGLRDAVVAGAAYEIARGLAPVEGGPSV